MLNDRCVYVRTLMKCFWEKVVSMAHIRFILLRVKSSDGYYILTNELLIFKGVSMYCTFLQPQLCIN
jgi:hypothetical protein